MTGQCQGSYYMFDHTISLKVNRVLVVFAYMPKLPDKKRIYLNQQVLLHKLLFRFCKQINRFMKSQVQSYDQVEFWLK